MGDDSYRFGLAATKRGRESIIFAPVDADLPYFPPRRHYSGDAGFDLTVAVATVIQPRQFQNVRSNVKVALPDGKWGYIVGRSSTFLKRGLLANTGIIDQGWRGELWAMVYNPGTEPAKIEVGDRLVQLIIFNLVIPELLEVSQADFPDGDRGWKGVGSTGQ